MAVRYRVNLIREELARRSARRRALQPVIFGILALDLMLLATFAVYLARDAEHARLIHETKNLLDNMQFIKPEEVSSLRQNNTRLGAMVSTVAKVVDNSTAWSSALSLLAPCGGTEDLCFGRIASRVDPDNNVFVVVEGICRTRDPMPTLQEFLAAVARQQTFKSGRVVSFSKRTEDEAFNFIVEIPLKALQLSSVVAPPPAAPSVKPAPTEKPL